MTPTSGGLFITVDGPGGVGKSTVTAAVAKRLRAMGSAVRETREPTDTPLGNLARHGTDEYQGLTMAMLIAADRYQHLKREVRPALSRGEILLCDRYVASSLVLQRIDGVAPEIVWDVNRHADRPNLSIFLTADPDVIAKRLSARGAHSRYERIEGSSHREHRLYQEAATFLGEEGFRTFVLDATDDEPEDLARVITAEVAALLPGVVHDA